MRESRGVPRLGGKKKRERRKREEEELYRRRRRRRRTREFHIAVSNESISNFNFDLFSLAKEREGVSWKFNCVNEIFSVKYFGD